MGILTIARRVMTRFRASLGGFFDNRLWYPTSGGKVTTSQVVVSEETALNYSAVWCATRLLCGTGASLPLPVYKGLQDGDREKDRTHSVYRLLNMSPNPEMTAFNFRSIMWQWQINWGNAYAEIVREGNDPEAPVVALFPLHPCRVTLYRDENERLLYKVKNETTREDDILQPWQMLHIPSVLTCDGIIGKGVIEHARETIGTGIAAEKRAADDFGNGRLPKVVVESPGMMTAENRDAFRKEWNELHSGANGHQVAQLGGGATAKVLSMSAADSQYIESRQFTVEEIARWYSVPPHLLQHLLRATFSNVEELGRDFVQYSLTPWLEIWEQVISQKLLYPNEDEYFAEHNVDALQRGNSQARAEFYGKMVSAALMTRNECRKLENLPVVEGGDTFLVQGATVPLDDDGRPESEFAGTAGGQQDAPKPASDPQDSDDDPEADTSIMAKSIASYLHRVIEGDLRRFLTKETKAVAGLSKKSGNFLALVDEFYTSHRVLLRDELGDTFAALHECGHEQAVDAFIDSWVKEAKDSVLASTNVKNDELIASVQAILESKTWSERPERAVERLRTCNL